MPAINGADVLLLALTAPNTYTVVGSQRDVSIEEGVGTVDVSSKTTGPQTRLTGGRYSSSISLDALYVPTDAAHVALRTAFRSRALIKVRVSEGGASTEEAEALITSWSRSFPDQGEATVSLSLEVNGAWAAV